MVKHLTDFLSKINIYIYIYINKLSNNNYFFINHACILYNWIFKLILHIKKISVHVYHDSIVTNIILYSLI